MAPSPEGEGNEVQPREVGRTAVAARERTDKHRAGVVQERGREVDTVLEMAGVAAHSAVAGMHQEGMQAEGARGQEGSSLLAEDIVPDTDAAHTEVAGYTGAEGGAAAAEELDTVHTEMGEGSAGNFQHRDSEGSPGAGSHVLEAAAAVAQPREETAGVVAVHMALQAGFGWEDGGGSV
jgi:hypothetical protein